ncbi:myocyte-specific enhancer factor 2A isoform X1 [Esox lucius]|uniref:MADS-box domain-containing protein n=1 Tax=Esox lucius TaxID=8010 RepID=A0AAY5L1N0_ESOLU|nr:myocyte-specific enhancer factor 2A isoform X1 [Esox lucius]XP_010878951.2 myocyte-specific enhancer factor 2A isoform X1 [Esox lucius]
MGRKKIQITRIIDERNRQVTFTKRKFGLMKKAYELSVLCDCEIALIIFNSSNKLFQYASTDMDKVLLKYTEYNEPHESRTNADIVEKLRNKGMHVDCPASLEAEDSFGHRPGMVSPGMVSPGMVSPSMDALSKKEPRGCESPDPEVTYVLTPHTEEKYKQINEEFDIMMRNHKMTPSDLSQQQQIFSLQQVPLPVSTSSTGHSSSSMSCYIPGGSSSQGSQGSQAQNLPNIQSPCPGSGDRTSSLHSSSHHHHRNLQQPSTLAQQRPPSKGSAGGMQHGGSDHSVLNGSGHGLGSDSNQPGNGFSPSGACLGKVLLPKSPPPTEGSSGPSTRNKPDLRVVIPPSSKGMMLPLTNQRSSSCQSSQSLVTPVVYVTTPSLGQQGLMYPGINSAYNNDYSLSSTDLSSLSTLQAFSSPSGMSTSNMSAWQHHQLGQLVSGNHGNQVPGLPASSLPSGTNQIQNNVNIKSEPISPPRERGFSQPPSGFLAQPPPAPPHHSASSNVSEIGRSPADSISSSCSSYEEDREEHQPDFHSSSATLGLASGLGRAQRGVEERATPSGKRMRMDSWVT